MLLAQQFSQVIGPRGDRVDRPRLRVASLTGARPVPVGRAPVFGIATLEHFSRVAKVLDSLAPFVHRLGLLPAASGAAPATATLLIDAPQAGFYGAQSVSARSVPSRHPDAGGLQLVQRLPPAGGVGERTLGRSVALARHQRAQRSHSRF